MQNKFTKTLYTSLSDIASNLIAVLNLLGKYLSFIYGKTFNFSSRLRTVPKHHKLCQIK